MFVSLTFTERTTQVERMKAGEADISCDSRMTLDWDFRTTAMLQLIMAMLKHRRHILLFIFISTTVIRRKVNDLLRGVCWEPPEVEDVTEVRLMCIESPESSF